MPSNVFVSFDHDDQAQVTGFKLLKDNPNYPLDFHDHSLKEPVKDQFGRIIKYPPSDPKSKPVRDEISTKLNKSSRLVVLIGDETHKSAWVDWEIKEFYWLKFTISGDQTWKRIKGMKLKGSAAATIPKALINMSKEPLNWNPEELNNWLGQEV